ncbi:MAG: large conductance mechanosensitive channel protein MscL [Clostridiales bacterium]|nr:large conductance mechanosensitive channel protein MscL [Clostridiales bacterium]
MKKFLTEFKDFAVKGNMVDMSVGIVIGAAFNSIITNIVDCLITPLINYLIGLLTGGADAATAVGTIGIFDVGTLVGAIINFVITAFVLFLIVKAINNFHKKEEAPAAPTTKTCPYCKSEIHIEATKCAHCGSDV